MKIIDIPAPCTSRKAFKFESEDEKNKYTSFKPGIRVLPAPYFDTEFGVQFFFIARHEHGEKGWAGGGYECRDSTGGARAFYLDALIVHPNELKIKTEIINESVKRRGRKRIKPLVEKDPNAPKRKRGRPSIDPEKRISKPYVPTGGKRGRKPLSDEEKAKRAALQPAVENKPKGKRGRPTLAPELRKTKPYVPTGGKRGRKPKNK